MAPSTLQKVTLVGPSFLAGACQLVDNIYTQRSLIVRPPQAAVPQLGSWGLLAAPLIRSYYYDERDAVGTTASY